MAARTNKRMLQLALWVQIVVGIQTTILADQLNGTIIFQADRQHQGFDCGYSRNNCPSPERPLPFNIREEIGQMRIKWQANEEYGYLRYHTETQPQRCRKFIGSAVPCEKRYGNYVCIVDGSVCDTVMVYVGFDVGNGRVAFSRNDQSHSPRSYTAGRYIKQVFSQGNALSSPISFSLSCHCNQSAMHSRMECCKDMLTMFVLQYTCDSKPCSSHAR